MGLYTHEEVLNQFRAIFGNGFDCWDPNEDFCPFEIWKHFIGIAARPDIDDDCHFTRFQMILNPMVDPNGIWKLRSWVPEWQMDYLTEDKGDIRTYYKKEKPSFWNTEPEKLAQSLNI